MASDAQTGERDRNVCTWARLVSEVVSEVDRLGPRADPAKVGALRGSTFKLELPRWLRQQLVEGNFARIHWPTLRSFSENQPLAKRLWIYLQAEHLQAPRPRPGGNLGPGGRPSLHGARDGLRPPPRRHAALVRACQAIRFLDVRYRALDVVRLGRSWRITADRLSSDELRWTREEREAARAALREAGFG